MKFINKTKILSYLPQIIAMLFLAGFIAYAWQEPGSAPPGGNVPAPINVGTTAQTKQGALTLGSTLKVEGNLLDRLGRVIYSAATGKIDRARLPFEQGDITSDVDTNTYDTGYFNVSNLMPGNIVDGLAFGRNQTGTAIKMLPGEMGAYGAVGVYSGTGINDYCRSNKDCTGYSYGNHFDSVGSLNEHDPRNILNMTISGTSGCYTGSYGACTFKFFSPTPTFSCAPRWQFYNGVLGTNQGCGPQMVCGYCRLNY